MNPVIKILIIDDDPQMRALTRASLLRYAPDSLWDMVEFPDGAQGLDHIVAAHPLPDIILLDIHMSVMDGIAFLRAYEQLALPERGPDIYILSTVAGEWSGPGTFPQIVRSFFEKPLTADHVHEMIQNYRLRLCS
ncbi:MAG: hypothetical protein JWO03_2152 [Bacteroidetes bacterium]|nr:hypothetical protein [Bacteroidota bacterium]